MFVIKLLAFIAFFASLVWFCVAPDYEPGIAAVTSLSALIGLWLSQRQSQSRDKPSQAQTVGAGSVAVQAGRDAHVGNISHGGPKDA